MAKITYENKVALNQNPNIPDINKVNDTDMNMIKNVVNNNETKVLLAVSSSAPATCDTGEIYFNTTDNLIYTATATNTWGSTGVAPTENTIYIEFTTQTAYAYDGTTLVSVGGGSGSEIVIGDEEPTEDTKMIIDTDAFDPQYSDITDEYSEANNKAYSCDYINSALTYSTDEVNTHKKWIDGKDIYRKMITASITGTGQQNVAHNIINLDNVVKCDGVIKVGTNEWFILPMSGPTDNISGYGLSIQSINTTNILVFSGSNMGSTTRTLYAILEYTKTTDQGGNN